MMEVAPSSLSIDALTTGLVDSTAANISHPFYHIMVAVVQLGFKHFQVTNFEAGRSKGDLEMKANKNFITASDHVP